MGNSDRVSICRATPDREAVKQHSPGLPRSGAPWVTKPYTTLRRRRYTNGRRGNNTNDGSQFMKPRWGLYSLGGPVTQGALRDPGLCCETLSALKPPASRPWLHDPAPPGPRTCKRTY